MFKYKCFCCFADRSVSGKDCKAFILTFDFHPASVWPVIQPPVCVAWPEKKLNSSGSAIQSFSKSVKSVSWCQADLLSLLPFLICIVCMSYSFLQRTHRHELFTPPAIGAAVEEGQNKFQVSHLSYCNGHCVKRVLPHVSYLKKNKKQI